MENFIHIGKLSKQAPPPFYRTFRRKNPEFIPIKQKFNVKNNIKYDFLAYIRNLVSPPNYEKHNPPTTADTYHVSYDDCIIC